MLVGVCRIEIFLSEADSLKAKRMVTTSLKSRIRSKFNVAVAEIANQEKWQRLSLGVALISTERKMIDATITRVMALIERDGRVEILEHLVELY